MDSLIQFFSLGIDRTSFGITTGPGGFIGLGEVAPVSPFFKLGMYTSCDHTPGPYQRNCQQVSNCVSIGLSKSKVYDMGRPQIPDQNSSDPQTWHQASLTNTTSFNVTLDNGNAYTKE